MKLIMSTLTSDYQWWIQKFGWGAHHVVDPDIRHGEI